MKPLEPFDLIDTSLATIPPDYKKRATRLTQFKFLSVYVLSREDIVLSKMSRLNERDLNDVKELLPASDVNLIFKLAHEILDGDFVLRAKQALANNLEKCLEEFCVSDYVQQLSELRKRL
jgi:hypothetical protein